MRPTLEASPARRPLSTCRMICCLIPCRQSRGLGFLVPRRGKHRSGLARRRRKQTVCEPSAGGTHKVDANPMGKTIIAGHQFMDKLWPLRVRVYVSVAASQHLEPRLLGIQRGRYAWAPCREPRRRVVAVGGAKMAALDSRLGWLRVGGLPCAPCP